MSLEELRFSRDCISLRPSSGFLSRESPIIVCTPACEARASLVPFSEPRIQMACPRPSGYGFLKARVMSELIMPGTLSGDA